MRITPGEQPFVCCVALVGATCDLPAKAAVMNMVQYNGYWGCGRCLQKGILTHSIRIYKTIDSHSCHLDTRVSSGGGQTQTYPYLVENPCGPPRTHQQVYKYAKFATSSSSPVRSTCISACYMHPWGVHVFPILQVCMALSNYIWVYGIKGHPG